MNWNRILKGAGAAALAGGLAAAGASLADPTHTDWQHLAGAFAGGAMAGVLAYFKMPPPKQWDGVDRRAEP